MPTWTNPASSSIQRPISSSIDPIHAFFGSVGGNLRILGEVGRAMIEDDLIGSLTRQVKEEVLENYLTERRLIRLQVEEVERAVETVIVQAVRVGRRLNRLALLMVHPEMKRRMLDTLKVPQPSFWAESAQKRFSRRIRLIRVNAITDRRKFRKLVVESYRRLFEQVGKYRKTHESLRKECEAVNHNIRNFQKNFDLLNILNFLRSLDIQGIERKQVLGDNFSPEEMASVDQKLYIKPLSIDAFPIPPPLELPPPSAVEAVLIGLSEEVFRKYADQVKNLMV